jgi:YbdK family carboxylate-amine ligase
LGISFVPSQATSVGVEWEIELVDLETRHLRSCASEILSEISGEGDSVRPKVKHELLESIIEVNTGVCQNVGEARADLQETMLRVRRVAEARGVGLMSSGTHPFTDWRTQEVVSDPRYARLINRLQWLARRLQIFGVHYHVGVRSAAKVIPILNALTGYLPHILALSASSPFWKGHDTGLASARTKIFEQLPTAGEPPQLSDWKQFEGYVQALVSSRTIQTIREVWWDIRPHPDFGTIEFRICDGLPTLEEIMAHAALSQCLVAWLDRELDRGSSLPTPTGWRVRENKWRAVRHGLDAELIVDDQGGVVPIRQAIQDLVEGLRPVARMLDCEAELVTVLGVLEVGASYQRQRATAAATGGDLVAVVDSLLEEMRSGLVPASSIA